MLLASARRCPSSHTEAGRPTWPPAEQSALPEALGAHAAPAAAASALLQGSARVLMCLGGLRGQLSSGCSAALFDHETRLADDIDFKWALARACLVESDLLCPGIEQGGGRMLRCLQDHKTDESMSTECLQQLRLDEASTPAAGLPQHGAPGAAQLRLPRPCGHPHEQALPARSRQPPALYAPRFPAGALGLRLPTEVPAGPGVRHGRVCPVRPTAGLVRAGRLRRARAALPARQAGRGDWGGLPKGNP